MSSNVTPRDCAGCRDDFYNHNAMGLNVKEDGKPRCWSMETATMVSARDIPANMRPPYLVLPLRKRPSCYHAPGYSRVKAESLTSKGHWK